MMGKSRVLEQLVDFSGRIATVETLMKNHLKHHETYIKYFLFPMAVGIGLLLAEKVYSYVSKTVGG